MTLDEYKLKISSFSAHLSVKFKTSLWVTEFYLYHLSFDQLNYNASFSVGIM